MYLIYIDASEEKVKENGMIAGIGAKTEDRIR